MSDLGDSILQALQEAVAYTKGHRNGERAHEVQVPERIDVKALRNRLRLTQRAFARQFGFSVQSVRNWEQELRFPPRTARLLLKLIDCEPDFVSRTLADERAGDVRASHRRGAAASVSWEEVDQKLESTLRAWPSTTRDEVVRVVLDRCRALPPTDRLEASRLASILGAPPQKEESYEELVKYWEQFEAPPEDIHIHR